MSLIILLPTLLLNLTHVQIYPPRVMPDAYVQQLFIQSNEIELLAFPHQTPPSRYANKVTTLSRKPEIQNIAFILIREPIIRCPLKCHLILIIQFLSLHKHIKMWWDLFHQIQQQPRHSCVVIHWRSQLVYSITVIQCFSTSTNSIKSVH